MKATRGRVVNGKIVTRAKFPEGAELTVVLRDEQPPVDLIPEDEDAMLRGIEAIRQGEGVSLDQVRALLRLL